MKVFLTVIAFLMVSLTYILLGGSILYTLQSENSDFNDIIKWIHTKKASSEPIPVNRGQIQLANRDIKYTSNLLLESETSNYIGTVEFLGEKRNPDLHIKWYSSDGNPVGAFIDSWQYDDPFPVYKINSETGDLIAVDIFTNVRIINPESQITNQYKILPEYRHNNENVIYTEVINNRLISAICEVIPVQDGNPVYKSSMRIFDLQGKPIMQFEKPGWQIQAMGVSPDGKNIGVSFYQWIDSPKSELQFNTLILEESGKIIFQIPVGFQNLVFNDDKSLLILMDKNSFHLFDLLKKQQIGSYSTLESNSLLLAAVFLSPSETIVLQEGKPLPGIPGSGTPWKYESIHIRTLSEEGEELNPLVIENITLFNPSLHYNKEKETLFIGHSTGWKLYKVEK
jgi:hypothetical protein